MVQYGWLIRIVAMLNFLTVKRLKVSFIYKHSVHTTSQEGVATGFSSQNSTYYIKIHSCLPGRGKVRAYQQIIDMKSLGVAYFSILLSTCSVSSQLVSRFMVHLKDYSDQLAAATALNSQLLVHYPYCLNIIFKMLSGNIVKTSFFYQFVDLFLHSYTSLIEMYT